MAVETVSYTMEVPKEGKEVWDAASALVAHFVNGGDLATAATLLPAVMTAADGAGKVMEELKSQYKDELAAYGVHKMWDALEKKAPAAPEGA